MAEQSSTAISTLPVGLVSVVCEYLHPRAISNRRHTSRNFYSKVMPLQEHFNRLINLHYSKDAALLNTAMKGGWLVPTHKIFDIMRKYAQTNHKPTVVICKGSPEYLLSLERFSSLTARPSPRYSFQAKYTVFWRCGRADMVLRISMDTPDREVEEAMQWFDYTIMHTQALWRS